ncbi:hypothetical protein RRX38_20970 [Pseudomonas sp. DTU_2021_1001937_2_SI_NGA_ILE_001]|uniref:hypothetical protein n=1 Tax=Pseudomonas sp. DTU_2021_1001937_2_SI_NGA_ILE_001 TaxID=3077589 RepID=UPI0028FC2B36|nr:hypothetical protein [Pseudomonas sp. DTU_2021_1001937_2_SI_NGA_ILE_001]WNW13526.1 hypothetical protein RRX38_20970 [Pseudomonas sp. DTU_2021_1001937_2_SI_NGA_ILE_001]
MHSMALGRCLLAAALVGLGGCASIVSESRTPVSINSYPAGAAYQITNEDGALIHSGVTPDQVTLKAGAGYFDGETYKVTFKKDGYTENSSVINTSMNGWYWGNILFGGLIGMLIVDPLTGAMYKLPDNTYASLASLPAPAQPSVPAASVSSNGKSKEQLLDELAADKTLSYDEYLRRHKLITQGQ